MDTQRLILFFVFSFSLILLWEAWQKETRPPVVAPASIPAAPSTASKAPGTEATPRAEGIPGAHAAQEGQPSERVRVKTDLVIAEIDTRGGDIVYLELLAHRETLVQQNNWVRLFQRVVLQRKEPVEEKRNFVLFGPEHHYAAQSGLTGGLPNHKTLFSPEAKDYQLAQGQDRVEVRLHAVVDGVRVTKTLVFHRSSYVIDVMQEVINGGRSAIAPYAYYQLTRDGRAPAGDPQMVRTFTGVAVHTEQDQFVKISFEDIDKGKGTHPTAADNGWIAIVQHYFVAAWLPAPKLQREFYTDRLEDGNYRAGVKLPLGTIAQGTTVKVDVPLYAGPQQQDKLQSIAPGLNLVVDYGHLTVIAAPLFWVLKLFYSWLGNWGLAIILLTIVIKLLFFPLSAASYRSMAKMKLVTPRMMKLREQYADDKMKLNQAMMELYKTEKINPLGGCLPILVQIPVFIALYWVLLASVELRHAPFYLWITDLSAEDPWSVLPALMLVSMLIQTKMNPTPPDPVQARVMMIMPFVFGVMFFFFPSGLVLYWLVNNILSIAQQWQITRMIEGKKPRESKR
jgi:YidC/Oxa1 family membrane protein insertase